MKKAIFIFIFLVLAILAMAQKETVNQELSNGNSREVLPVMIFFYMNEFEESYYYDDFLGYNYDTSGIFELNTMDSDSLWCIGMPNKGVWDTTTLLSFSRPNALMTDTVNAYPPNNHSIFELSIKKPEWTYFYNYCWSRFLFQMSIACDTDTLKDGIYIEISFDGGESFSNLLEPTNVTSLQNGPDRYENFAFPQNSFVMDTIKGYSGNVRELTNEYVYMEGIEAELLWNDSNGFNVSEAIVRVHFVSDSIDNQRKGVLIDNLTVSVEEWCHYVDIDDFENPKNESVFVSPNPINENSKILFNNTENNLAQIRIFSNTGKLIEVYSTKKDFIEISKSEFNKGIYIFQIQVGDKYYNGKFVVV